MREKGLSKEREDPVKCEAKRGEERNGKWERGGKEEDGKQQMRTMKENS